MEGFERRRQVPRGLYRQYSSLLPCTEMHAHCKRKERSSDKLRRPNGIARSRPAVPCAGASPQGESGLCEIAVT